MGRSRMYEQDDAEIARRQSEEAMELPTSLDGEVSNGESKKTRHDGTLKTSRA